MNIREEVNNSLIWEGYDIGEARGIAIGEARGEARGELKGKIHAILKLLQIKFSRVPDSISDELNRRTDLVALESLFDLAAQCDSIDAFAGGLK